MDLGRRKLSAPVFTEPEPFTEVPLAYGKAFGGSTRSPADSARRTRSDAATTPGNPQEYRRGAASEHRGRLPADSFLDRPSRVGGIRPHREGWAPRVGYLGTYDFYNVAPPGLQVAGYLRGDEEILLLNLEKSGKVRFRLPGIAPVATVEKTERWSGPSWNEPAPMRLDTLCLLPDEGRLFLVWRGRCP